ncbi:MAG: hypothetical protein ACHQEM_00645 [Chitinophagales bacterium]
MTFRNKWLFIAFSILSIAGLIYQWLEHNRKLGVYDMPGTLSNKLDTLLLVYVKRDCNCAEWIQWSDKKNGDSAGRDKYIWLEAANPGLELATTYPAYSEGGYRLKVEGSFYEGRTIPNDYVARGDQKPEKARVFRYISSALIKPE